MFRLMFNSLLGQKKRNPARGRRRLEFETLEDRITPTIVFQPHFGPETITNPQVNNALQSPDVFVIFWGSYWGSPQGTTDEGNILTGIKSIINSTYLQGEIQYGGNGTAIFGATWTDGTSDPPQGFTTQNLQGFLQRTIDNQASPIPRPSTAPANHIYAVITEPGINSSLATGLGYNTTLYYKTPTIIPSFEAENTIWAGTGTFSLVNIDNFTSTFSHELAEMSDQNAFILPAQPPSRPQ